MSRRTVAALVLTILLQAALQAAEITGTVYRDANANGERDGGEAGLPDVRVTDGHTISTTDAEGRYRLEAPEGYTVVRASWPDGYWPTANQYWSGLQVPAAGATADVALRPLTERERGDGLRIVQLTDIHTRLDSVDLVKQVCAQVNELEPSFVIATGDLVIDANPQATEEGARALYAAYAEGVSPLQAPLLHVPGNHEMCATSAKEFAGDTALVGEGLYRRSLGPLYYSFHRGGCYFLLLHGTAESKPGEVGGGYRAGLTEAELAWLGRELSLEPAETPMCIFSHEPAPDLANKDALARLLAGRKVLGLFAGHTHRVARYESAGYPVWETAAVSGSWWSGAEKKANCWDGSPAGYRLIHLGPQRGLETMYRAEWLPEAVTVQSSTYDAEGGSVTCSVAALSRGNGVTRFALRLAGQTFEAPARAAGGGLWKEADLSGTVPAGAPGGLYGVRVEATTEAGTTMATDLGRPLFRPLPTAELDGQHDGVLRFYIVNQNCANEVHVGDRTLTMEVDPEHVDRWFEFEIPAGALRGPAEVRIVARTNQEGPVKPGALDDFSIEALSLQVGDRHLYANETVRRALWIGDNAPERSAEVTFHLAEVPTLPQPGAARLVLQASGIDAADAVSLGGAQVGLLAKGQPMPAEFALPPAAGGPAVVRVAAVEADPGNLDDFVVDEVRLEGAGVALISAESGLRLGDGNATMVPAYVFHLLPWIAAE